MDDFRMYDVELTNAEVAAIYNGGSGDHGTPSITSSAAAYGNKDIPLTFNVTASVPHASADHA